MNAHHQLNKRISKKDRNELRMENALQRKFTRRLWWMGGTVLIIGGISLFITLNQKSLPGQIIEVMEDQTHIADANSPHTPYNSDPPTSGPHLEYIAHWGVHKEPLPKELLVHNLEDGGVVIYYSRQADKTTVEKLENIVKRYEKFVLVNPDPDMVKNTLTLTAWGRMDKLEVLDEERVIEFIEAYKGIDRHKYTE